MIELLIIAGVFLIALYFVIQKAVRSAVRSAIIEAHEMINGKDEKTVDENNDEDSDGSEEDMIDTVVCPNCGKTHDMDYPKCPHCKYQD
jgi:rubrerythrin